jgi:hypothetical protein
MDQLIRFRIPSGWAVKANQFFDTEPIFKDGILINSEDFTEDALWLDQLIYDGETWTDNQGLTIDLGWYGNIGYRLVAFRGSWDNIMASFRSKDRFEVRDILENWLLKPPIENGAV